MKLTHEFTCTPSTPRMLSHRNSLENRDHYIAQLLHELYEADNCLLFNPDLSTKTLSYRFEHDDAPTITRVPLIVSFPEKRHFHVLSYNLRGLSPSQGAPQIALLLEENPGKVFAQASIEAKILGAEHDINLQGIMKTLEICAKKHYETLHRLDSRRPRD